MSFINFISMFQSAKNGKWPTNLSEDLFLVLAKNDEKWPLHFQKSLYGLTLPNQ